MKTGFIPLFTILTVFGLCFLFPFQFTPEEVVEREKWEESLKWRHADPGIAEVDDARERLAGLRKQ